MVYFVGAGPGAIDLITIRGDKLLKEADVIIYAGSLVNPELFKDKKASCEVWDSSGMTLEEVIRVLNEAEKQNKASVRLHTGDPCLYGAIREQMDALTDLGIDYEVVAGVSSFCGAAAALKAEYTLPDISQTVILTRMAGRTPSPALEDIELLAAHKSTMVIFLSAGLLEGLEKKLISGGYSPDTPAAIVYKASWPDEKVFHCRLSELAKTACENAIKQTALILVGDFLGKDYGRSKLYNPKFTHGFRIGESDGKC